MRWIEIVTGFECNCRCRVCPSASQAGIPAMSGDEIAHWLEEARRQGAQHVWFGGGEPTLHPALMPSLSRAADLGFGRIRVQTNGMRFAYRPYTMRCLASGATEISVSVMGADPNTHDAMTRNDRSFELMCRGIENLSTEGARVEADVLMTSVNIEQLPAMVTHFSSLGVSGFRFWLTSMHGMEGDEIARMVPRLNRVVKHLEAAFLEADRLGAQATSWHTPPCVLPVDQRHRYVHSGTLDLVVVTPGGEPFRAEDSPMEGGHTLEGCKNCSARGDCLGVRRDYVDLFGPEEFVPIES